MPAIDAAGDAPRRMNWGCGARPTPGWLNSDRDDGPGVDLAVDLLDGLPLPDDGLDYIVSVHGLNAVAYPDLVPALEELRRVLRPGGVLRLVLPDLDKAIAAYIAGDHDYFYVPDEDEPTVSGKMIVQLLWYGTNLCLFTEEFARSVLQRAGFRTVTVCRCGESASGLDGITELDNRERESFYIEATK